LGNYSTSCYYVVDFVYTYIPGPIIEPTVVPAIRFRYTIGQLDKDLTVRDIGQLIKGGDISLVSRRGESRLSGVEPSVSTAPLL